MSKSSKTVNFDSRKALIITATNLFQRQGYYATGLNEILNLTGIPKGSLYHHFRGGKVDLAIACVEFLCEQVVQYLQRARDDKTRFSELISQLVLEAEAWLVHNEWSCGSLFATLSHEAKPGDTALREALRESYTRIQNRILLHLQEEGASAEKAEELALNTLLSFEGALSLSATLGNASPLKNIEAFLLKALDDEAQ